MPTFRLLEESPFFKKFDELCCKADELGLRIEFGGCNTNLVVIDTTTSKSYELKDIEPHHWIEEFPPQTEYKLTYEE